MIRLLSSLFLLLLTNCVIDSKESFFKNKNNKNVDNIEFNYDLSFTEYKKNIINYGELSSYPKLDD